MPVARVRGTRIHYRVEGAGEPVVLIHGLGSSGDDWELQVRALAPHYRVIVPDLRGSGRSGKPRAVSRPGFRRRRLGVPLGIERASLVGFRRRRGRPEMALRRPGAVDRLVLINSLPHYSDTWRKWFEAHLTTGMVQLLGLARTARLVGSRMFPHPHQQV